MSIRSDLLVAIEAADAADAMTLPHFRSTALEITTKDDTTPVTAADRGAEQAIRDIIGSRRPDDSVLGEEFGVSGTGERRWIVDPIDATNNFVRGVPVWATLIALQDEDGIALGVVSAPALGRRWWAARGLGAWGNAARIRVSSTPDLAGAFVSINSVNDHEKRGLGEEIRAVTGAAARTRGFGDFWSFMLLAEGGVDVVVEPIAAIWDLAALLPIVEEAGGRFTDLTGDRTIEGGNAVATNGHLHDEVLGYF